MKDELRIVIDEYMETLYGGGAEGNLLASIKEFEKKLTEYAEANPDAEDVLLESGLQDQYSSLYMAVINGNNDYSIAAEGEGPKIFDASKTNRAPTVHEFLDNYRYVYETAVKPNKRDLTDAAYQKLFDVENRTDDIIEAQMIIEREHLIVNTVTADYKYIANDFLEATDPNYEIVSSGVKATISKYAEATSLDEVTYMGEVAQAVCNDIGVQSQVKATLMANFLALIFAWEHSKGKVREGGKDMVDHAKAMTVTRMKLRQFYKFLCEDMGITYEDMEKNPFYRISFLKPSGLDELWRIKMVMHPDNFKAAKHVLFNEVLSDKTLGEILMVPQPVPYYKELDSAYDSAFTDRVHEEYQATAEELNKGIKYFQRNMRASGKKIDTDPSKAIAKGSEINKAVSTPSAGNSGAGGGKIGGAISSAIGGKVAGGNLGGVASAFKSSVSQTIKSQGKAGMAKSVAKDAGKGFLRRFLGI